MKFLSLFCLLVALAGCVSAEERQRRADERARIMVAGWHDTCTGFGFAPRTEAFANCMLKMYETEIAQRHADSAAAQARAQQQNNAIQNYWNTYRAVTAPYRGGF